MFPHEVGGCPGLVGVVEEALDDGGIGGVFIRGCAQLLVFVAADHDVVLARVRVCGVVLIDRPTASRPTAAPKVGADAGGR